MKIKNGQNSINHNNDNDDAYQVFIICHSTKTSHILNPHFIITEVRYYYPCFKYEDRGKVKPLT